jgi:hypothetical protein
MIKHIFKITFLCVSVFCSIVTFIWYNYLIVYFYVLFVVILVVLICIFALSVIAFVLFIQRSKIIEPNYYKNYNIMYRILMHVGLYDRNK